MENFKRSFSLAFVALSLAGSMFAQSNKSLMASGANCSGFPTTLAITAQGQRRAAAGNGAIRFFTTDNATGTVIVDCDLTELFASRIGSSARITSVDLFYGFVTNPATVNAATVANFVTLPTSGAAAAGTVSAAGGVLTATPAVLQLTATTSGQCFHEKITFGTPIAGSDRRRVILSKTFTFGAAITTIEICGIQLNYIDTP